MPALVPVAISLLAANIWPLIILVLAVVGVTIVALVRADRADIPAIFASFAQAFGIHKIAGPLEKPNDTGKMAPTSEIERPGEETR